MNRGISSLVRPALILPALASALLLSACSRDAEPLLKAASLEEATRLAAASDALVLVEFWRDG